MRSTKLGLKKIDVAIFGGELCCGVGTALALARIGYAGPFVIEGMRGSPTMRRLSPLEAVNQSYAAVMKIFDSNK